MSEEANRPQPIRTTPRSWFRRGLHWVAASERRWATPEQLAQAVYGAVVGAAGIAVSSAHGGDLADIVLTVLVTVAVYWAAERYADVLATAVHNPRRERVLAALRRGRPTLQAGLIPMCLLVALDLLLTDRLPLAVFSALGLATLMLGRLGHLAARQAGAGRLSALGWSLGTAALGLSMIGLKILLH